MMVFVGCSKDDSSNSSSSTNGGSESQFDIADNTLVYDGTTYHMHGWQSYYHNQLTLVDAYSEETNGQEQHLFEFSGLHVRPGMWNRMADIFTETNEDVSWNFFIGGTVVEANAYDDFSACKVGIYGNNDGTLVTVTVDGTLNNGKTIQMKIITSSDNQGR